MSFIASRAVSATAGCAAAVLYLMGQPAQAQTSAWPAKTVRIIVPYPPGGGTDIIARVTAEKLQAAPGQSVVIENRAGANGIIGTEAVARAAPDGSRLHPDEPR